MRLLCSQGKRLHEHFCFYLILSGRAIRSHSPGDFGVVCFGFNASSLGKSPWEEQEKGRGFFHVMVTWVHSASARICPSDTKPFARNSNIPKDAQREPFQLQQVRRAGETECKQTEFSSSHYKGMFLLLRMLEVDRKLSVHCPAILQPEFRSFSLRLFTEWERGGMQISLPFRRILYHLKVGTSQPKLCL